MGKIEENNILNPWVVRMLAKICVMEDAAPLAEECFDSLAAKNPATAKNNEWLGQAYKRINVYAKAQKCFDTALMLDPYNRIALCEKAITCAKEGRYDDALHILGRALAKENPAERAHFITGRIHFMLGRFALAQRYFAPLLQRNDKKAVVYYIACEMKIGSDKNNPLLDVLKQMTGDEEFQQLVQAAADLKPNDSLIEFEEKEMREESRFSDGTFYSIFNNPHMPRPIDKDAYRITHS